MGRWRFSTGWSKKLADCGAEHGVNGAELDVQEARNTHNAAALCISAANRSDEAARFSRLQFVAARVGAMPRANALRPHGSARRWFELTLVGLTDVYAWKPTRCRGARGRNLLESIDMLYSTYHRPPIPPLASGSAIRRDFPIKLLKD